MTKGELQQLLENVVRKVMREEFRDILVEAVGIVEESQHSHSEGNMYGSKPVPTIPQRSVPENSPVQANENDPYNIKALLRETVLTAADRQVFSQVGAVEGYGAQAPVAMPAPEYFSENMTMSNSSLPDFNSFLNKSM